MNIFCFIVFSTVAFVASGSLSVVLSKDILKIPQWQKPLAFLLWPLYLVAVFLKMAYEA